MSIKKINTELENDAIFNSLGLLNKEERKVFKLKMSGLSGSERKTISDFNNLTSILPIARIHSDMNISPSPGLKKNLMEKIQSKENSKRTLSKEFDFVYGDTDEWFQHPEVEGIKVKQLAVNEDKKYVVLLMKVAAGTQYPPHHHSGAEECYVIDGDLYAQGRLLGPGDFHHADGGSDHEPLYTENGCTVLLVVDSDDY